MLRKKTAVEPTLEARVSAATTMATVHLAAFESAAKGLEATADELDAVRDAAAEEASRHLAIKVTADAKAFKNRQQAQKIRDLLL